MNQVLSHRRQRRGAVLVEAVILIPILILFWMGIGYFRELYTQKMRVARLARAATMAYAMGGCQEGVPASSLVAQDLTANQPTSDSPPESEGVGSLEGEPGADAPPSERANDALRSLQGSETSFLNEIGHTSVGAPVGYPTHMGARNGKVFHGSVGSTSWVSCGQKINPGDPFPEVFPKIEDIFDDLL